MQKQQRNLKIMCDARVKLLFYLLSLLLFYLLAAVVLLVLKVPIFVRICSFVVVLFLSEAGLDLIKTFP